LDNVKLSFNDTPAAPVVEWWAEDLAVLRFDFFQRVLAAMRTKGLRPESIGGAVMHYAHRALKGIHKRQIMKSPKPQVLIITFLHLLTNFTSNSETFSEHGTIMQKHGRAVDCNRYCFHCQLNVSDCELQLKHHKEFAGMVSFSEAHFKSLMPLLFLFI